MLYRFSNRHFASRRICAAATALAASTGLIAAASQSAFALVKHVKTTSHVLPVSAPLSRIAALPAPNGEPVQSLIYRAAEQPIGSHNGVAFWLMGDSVEGSIRVYLFASGGAAAGPLPVPGSGRDTEPLWPAFISNPISTNFSGWRKIVVAGSNMIYRAPVGAATSAPATPLSSVDAFGIASTKSDGALYVDAISWANIDANGDASGDSAVIDNFSTGDLTDWKVKGCPQAVARLIPGVTALQPYVKEDAVSLKLDYSGLTAERRILSRAVAQSLAQSGSDYLVSVPQSPFERVLPDSLPLPSEISSRVALTECPEQTSCGSFAVYSLHGLHNVSVRLTGDLFAIGKSIPRSNVNISVVKVWDRNGTGVLIDPDSSGPLPELLVKDDRIPLEWANGTPPDVRLTGDPTTDIPANSEKQFWIDIAVPPNTPPGQYTGQMLVRSNEAPPFRVSLEADVLPLRLLSPAKQYVVNYRGTLGDNSTGDVLPSDRITAEEMSSQLADVSQHGCHYVSLCDGPTTLSNALSAEQQYNFQTPLVYPVAAGASGLQTAEAVQKMGGSASYYYLVPPGPTMADDLAKLKAAGCSTAAEIDNQSEYDQNQSNLDVAIYPVDNAYVQQLLLSDGKRQSSTRDWLTWPAAQADPQVDRLYAGYLLWKSDLYGGYVSDYETCYGSNPYDDGTAPTDGVHDAMRPAMLTYPTQSGVIDTIQWESIREGIDDVRYLTTFYTALRECKDAKVDLVQVAKAQADVTAFLDRAFWLMSDVDYQKGRSMIAGYAVQLRKAVDSYNSRQSGISQQSSTEIEGKRKSG